MTDILILQGHPDPQSFVAALAAAYAEGAVSAGASVRTIDLVGLAFDPILRMGHHEPQPLEPDLEDTFAAIRAARHVVFAFPTWWAGPPALVKGFIDRVFLPGTTFRFDNGSALPTGLLAGRSARLMTTMDSPAIWYWWKHGRSLHRSFIDATLDFVGFAPIATRTVYSVRSLDAKARARAIQDAQRDGATDARRLASPARLTGGAASKAAS